MDVQGHFRVIFIIFLIPSSQSCQEICNPIGVADKNIIPDSSITASSSYNYYLHEPPTARLYSYFAWIPPKISNRNDYLQINLGKVFVICGVATRGRNDYRGIYDSWTKQFKISTSIDSNSWAFYSNDGSPKFFTGNTDTSTIVKNILEVPVSAKLIRFTPKNNEDKDLRVEVYSLNNKVATCQDIQVGVNDPTVIPDSSFTAKSSFGSHHGPSGARLDSNYAWKPQNNDDDDDYLQIDLGKVFVICAVMTRGNRLVSEWTKKYNISSSIDGTWWTMYPKELPGNTDRESLIKNVLDIPVQAKYIRFIPTDYSRHKALRAEVFGMEMKDFTCGSISVGVGDASVAKIPDGDMSSSSHYNSSTPPSNGRLGYTASSSWCASTSDSSSHLQIKLGSPYVICGVATQGDHMSDQWVQNYQIQTSTDGSSFTDYKENGVIKTFDGNSDHNFDSIVNNPLFDGAIGQYMRIRPKDIFGSTACMRTELYGVKNTVCSTMSAGLSYSSLVPDHRFSATSSQNNQHYSPSAARLGTSTSGWVPATNSGAWLQIDLGGIVFVCAVATQGAGSSVSIAYYTKKYKLEFSLDNIAWTFYKEQSSVKIFTGNVNKDDIVKNDVTVPFKAKFVRFHPTEWNSDLSSNSPSLRVDVHGVTSACSFPFGIEKDGNIGNDKISSSSNLDNAHIASHGRLYGDASWCSKTSSNTEYIQVDLGKMVTVSGIATQGDHALNKWVTYYTLKYSLDNRVWNTYTAGQNSAKMIKGNIDRSSIVARWLTHFITAQYIRIQPHSWNTGSTGACMRIELYGCTCPLSAAIKGLSNQVLTASANSYVDLVCKMQDPLVQNIEWSDGQDLTSRSTGITRGASFVQSVLRVNYTDIDDIYTRYQCSKKQAHVMCRQVFTCQAKYTQPKYGLKGKVEVKLSINYLSASPTPSVDNIQTTSVRVSWTQSTIRPSYQIKYRTSTSQVDKIINITHTASSNTINGLLACTYYYISLRAVSKIGDGPWNNARTVRTRSEVPSAPTVIGAVPQTSQSINVTWQFPSNLRCPPNGYEVVYIPASGGGGQTFTIDNGQTTSHTSNSLKKYTIYDISIKVRNEEGYGSPRSTTARTLQDAPDASPGGFTVTVINSTSVRLSWSLPPKDKQNGVIKGFKVWYSKTADGSVPKTIVYESADSLLNILIGLDMYTEYSFKVLAYTIKEGPYSAPIKKQTLEGPPSVPLNVKKHFINPVGSSGPHIKLTWDKPLSSNGIIRGYNVSIINKGDSKQILDSLKSDKFTSSLPVCGGVEYEVRIWAYTVEKGSEHVINAVKVPTYAPIPPTDLKSSQFNLSTFNLSWQPVPSTNGPIITYEVQQFLEKSSEKKIANVSCGDVPCRGSVSHYCSYILNNLQQCSTFNIRIRAYTSHGAGDFGTQHDIITSVPGPPRDLKKIDSNELDTVTLEWKKPMLLLDPVEKYTITYVGTKTYQCICDGYSLRGEKETTLTKYTITDLHPATTYTFTVNAITKCGKGKASNTVKVDTKTGAPPPPNVIKTVSLSDTDGMNITLWSTSSINGLIRGYQVIVHKNTNSKGRKRRSIDDSKLTDYTKAEKAGLPYYIAAEILFQDPKVAQKNYYFILGDGKDYGGYRNVELEKGVQYDVYQRALTTDHQNSQRFSYGKSVLIATGKLPATKTTKEPTTDPHPLPALLGGVFGVLIIILIIVIIIYRRRKSTKPEIPSEKTMNDLRDEHEMQEQPRHSSRDHLVQELNDEPDVSGGNHNVDEDTADVYGNAETILHQAVPVKMFYKYVNDKMAIPNFFENEFKNLSTEYKHSYDVAKDPKNKKKNRYGNIITYDHSRVVLQDTPSGSDYINASYIDGFDGIPKAYIATQGPNQYTIEDFWYLVWQENITTIVMLTNLVEAGKRKCNQYWPDSKDERGRLSVALHRSDVFADYIVRIFILAKDGKDSRQIYHYQYTSWPDKGVPEHATSLLGFRRKVHAHYVSTNCNSPLLVHCSAGVGRTGAYLVIDAMLKRAKQDQTIDIFNYVQLMRNNRTTMVQTAGQYGFVHFALQESLTCGNTEIAALNINIEASKLSHPRPKDGKTGLELQFSRLKAISPRVTNKSSKVGRMESNLPRNRYQDIIPFDSARVILSQQGHDYINASFTNTYRRHNAFILTQAPMDNTIQDFWTMILQYRCGTIVMLNQVKENIEVFPQYWPSEGVAENHNGITVELTSTVSKGPLVIRELVIRESSDDNYIHNVVHIHHTKWYNDRTPEDLKRVLDIVDRVQKSQQQCGDTPIVVHCSDGAGRSGTFCAVYSLLERVKAEQVIDVFQAVKVLRQGRPNAVATLDQYSFCLNMVKTYLDSFDDYANFSEV